MSLDVSCLPRLAALTLLAALAACARPTPPAPPTPQQPAFYINLGEAGAQLDAHDAVQTINLHRQRHGLAPLVIDADLMAMAKHEANAMANRDQPASADALRASLGANGYRAPMVNLSAGYRTMAEAFSGWRDSPGHNAAMLNKNANRIGVAASRTGRAGSKYRVYWALVTAAK